MVEGGDDDEGAMTLTATKSVSVVQTEVVDDASMLEEEEDEDGGFEYELDGASEGPLTGRELALLCIKKYGKAHDMAIKHVKMGSGMKRWVSLNLYVGHLGQRSYPQTEAEYLEQLDVIAYLINTWSQADYTRAFFREKPIARTRFTIASARRYVRHVAVRAQPDMGRRIRRRILPLLDVTLLAFYVAIRYKSGAGSPGTRPQTVFGVCPDTSHNTLLTSTRHSTVVDSANRRISPPRAPRSLPPPTKATRAGPDHRNTLETRVERSPYPLSRSLAPTPPSTRSSTPPETPRRRTPASRRRS